MGHLLPSIISGGHLNKLSHLPVTWKTPSIYPAKVDALRYKSIAQLVYNPPQPPPPDPHEWMTHKEGATFLLPSFKCHFAAGNADLRNGCYANGYDEDDDEVIEKGSI